MDFLANVPQLPDSLHPDARLYADRMAEIRQRVGIIRHTVASVKSSGQEDLASIELIFLQFRKCLELIAFGSLIANREAYSREHEKFASDWRVKRLIERLRRLNPDFFPVPVSAPVRTGPRDIHVAAAKAPYLTVDDLIRLYDTCADILHVPNPFAGSASVRHIGYGVEEWTSRIQGLLRWHYIQQTQSSRWLVEIPSEGPVRVYPSESLAK